MASDPHLYTGYRLSEVLTLGRETTTITCPPCGKRRTYTTAGLIDRLGDEVMPTVLTRMATECPTRGTNQRCAAVFAEPLTREDEAAIREMRQSGASPYPVLD